MPCRPFSLEDVIFNGRRLVKVFGEHWIMSSFALKSVFFTVACALAFFMMSCSESGGESSIVISPVEEEEMSSDSEESSSSLNSDIYLSFGSKESSDSQDLSDSSKKSSSSKEKNSSSSKTTSSSSKATSSSAMISFGPDSGPEYGILTDSRDGQIYKTLKIGDQTWTAENMNYAVPEELSWCYGMDSTKCGEYGRLYSWRAAVNACPSGWHLPSKKDWEELLTPLADSVVTGGRALYYGAGSALKTFDGWTGTDKGTDKIGFSVKPAGYRPAEFGYEGVFAFFWTSTEGTWGYNEYVMFQRSENYAVIDAFESSVGLSVRCVQGKSSSSSEPESSAQAKAVLMAPNTYDCSIFNCVTREFLNPDLTYYEVQDPRDKQVYNVITMGNIRWFAQNLNYKINDSQSWCARGPGEKGDCATYGRLYTWAGAIGESEEDCGLGMNCPQEDAVQGICPNGWRLPTSSDFEYMINYVTKQHSEYYYIDQYLKFPGVWNESYYGANKNLNSYGLSFIPAGVRDGDDSYIIPETGIWASTQYLINHAYRLSFMASGSYPDKSSDHKDMGYSVRCIQNVVY